MLAKCISVSWEISKQAAYFREQMKCGGHNSTFYDLYDQGRRQGWAMAHLILEVDIDGERQKTWVDKHFRKELKTLSDKTEHTTLLIAQFMPASINIQRKVSPRGKVYFVADTSDLDTWSSLVIKKKKELEKLVIRIGPKIKPLRLQNNMTQLQLAQKIGLTSIQVISALENGKHCAMTDDRFKKLAEALGVSQEFLGS